MLSRIFKLYKESFAGLNNNVWLLAWINLINRAGTMVIPFLSMYLTQEIGVSLTKAGFVLTCFGAGSILGALAGGKLTDKIGHYKVQMITLFFGGISFFILATLNDYNSICLMTFILALVNEAYRPANMSAIGLYSNSENRTRSSSLVRLTTNLGWAVGASLGGILASIDYKLLFWVDGATNLIAFVFLYLLLRPANTKKEKSESIHKATSSVYKDKEFLLFVLLSYFFAVCFFQIFSTYPVFLKKEFLISEHQIGILFAMNGLLIAFIEMITVHSLAGKRNDLQYIAFGLVLVGISFLVLNATILPTLLLAYISCLFFTIGEIFCMPFMMTFWMNRSNDGNRGQYASLYTVAYSLAHITGPLIGGFIADEIGFNKLWISIFIFSILTGLGFLLLQNFASPRKQKI
ncbi:MAG: MFS transporter [Saprospiraceae bacterium]|nr:MFS transporter [Saprospiraceae bacterium]